MKTMRYISLFIGGILALSACHEVKFAGNGESGMLTAGFRDSLVTVFENAGANKLVIDFTQPLLQETKMTVAVVAEENMEEGKDYFIPVKELVGAAGAKSVDVEFVPVDDSKVNDARSFTLKLVALNGGIVDERHAEVKVKVMDDESDVAVGFESTEMTVAERELEAEPGGSYRCEIPVKIYGTLHKPLQFKVESVFSESPDAAVEDVNFRLLQTVFVVEGATDIISVPVEIVDDGEVNTDRTFYLDIAEVVGGEVNTYQKRCAVIIKNDDLGIYFGIASVEAEERAGKIKIPVKLTSTTDHAVTFTVECSGNAVEGTDYTLEKNWTIEAGEEEGEIEVDLLHAAGVQDDRVLTLAFGELGADLQIFEKQPACDVTILDCNSLLGFEQADVMVLNDSTRLLLPIVLDGVVEHDVIFGIKVIAYEGISSEQVSVVNSEVVIPAGSVNGVAELALRKLSTKKKVNFQVEISDVYGASIGEGVCTVGKYYKYETTDLHIADFTSEEASGEGPGNGCAVNAIDGDTDKFWHSAWNGVTPVLPEGIVVELPDNLMIMGVDVVRRVHASNKDLKEMKIYLSESTHEFLREDDGTYWGEAVETFEWPNTASTQVEDNTRRLRLPVALDGKKYLKLACTASWRNSNVQIAEVVVYGYTK